MSPLDKHMGYLGQNTSLYTTLPSGAISDLEGAVLFTKIGLYQEALSIFEAKLVDFKHLPIVVIEWAETYLQQGRYGSSTEILEKGLQTASLEDGHFDLDRDEYRLISMFLGATEICSKGTLEGAVREIDRTKEWLAHVPVSDYTDIQVSVRLSW